VSRFQAAREPYQGGGEGGADQTTRVSDDTHRAYDQGRACNVCGGGWAIYGRQSFPGYQNAARDAAGQAMKNWWPFQYH
jgi:hypothetical protein